MPDLIALARHVLTSRLFAAKEQPQLEYLLPLASPRLLGACLLLALSCGVETAKAQSAGQIQNLRDNQDLRRDVDALRQQLRPSEDVPLPVRPELSAPAPAPWVGRSIQGVRIQGSVSGLPELQAMLLQDFRGQPASVEVIAAVRERVTTYYARRGLIALVGIEDPDAAGELGVSVALSSLGKVVVDINTAPISSQWAVRTLEASVRPGALLRLDKLESAMLKLNDLAGVSAEARLSPAETEGQTDVVISLARTDQVQAVVDLNNETLPYMGPYQAGGYLVLESLLGRGEYLTVDGGYSGNVNWYGSRSAGIDLSFPLAPDGLRLIGSYAWSDYRLLGQYLSMNSVGSASVGSLGFSQPLWRRPRTNVELSVSGGYGTFDQYQLGSPGVNVNVPVARGSLRIDHQDSLFSAIGLNAFLLTVSAGATQSASPQILNLTPYSISSSYGKGGWGKLYVLYDRYQSFRSSRYSLELFAQGQFATQNLYSSEQFSLGWPNAVRAYPPGEATGDAGLSVQLTSRYQLFGSMALKAFVDAGWIWPPSQTFLGGQVVGAVGLWGPGLGVEFGPRGNYLISVDVAFPLGRNNYTRSGLDADGANPDMRVWVSLKKWL